jgi:hypothetical protein
MTIWYTLCSFGTFFPVLVIFTEKNLATLLRGCQTSQHQLLGSRVEKTKETGVLEPCRNVYGRIVYNH